MVKIKLFVQGRGRLVGKAKDLTILTAMENTMSGFSNRVGDYVKITKGEYISGCIARVEKVESEKHWAVSAKIVSRKGDKSLVAGLVPVLFKGDYLRIPESNYPVLEHWLGGGTVVVPAVFDKKPFIIVEDPKWELGGCYFVEEENTYRQGQRFIFTGSGEEFILSRVGPQLVALIGLNSGNRWNEPVFVREPLKITQEEFDIISKSYSTSQWTLISS